MRKDSILQQYYLKKLPKYQNAGEYKGLFTRPSTNYSSDRAMIMSPQIRLQKELEEIPRKEKERIKKQIVNNPSFVGVAKKPTPESEATRTALLQQYLATHPYAQLDDNNNLLRKYWNRSMETQLGDKYTSAAGMDKGLTHMANAIDAAATLQGLPALARGVASAFTRRAPQTFISSGSQITRGPINWYDMPGFKERNPGITDWSKYMGDVKIGKPTSNIDESMMPFIEGESKIKPIETPSVGKSFKSEIDWAKWNPDTPKYPELINEYNTIEESTKKAGTWMKNPDGSSFQGTPEQFIQQQSSWFKKYVKDAGGNYEDVINDPFFYHGSKNKEIKEFHTPQHSDYKKATGDTPKTGIFITRDKDLADIYSSEKIWDGLTPKTGKKIGETYQLYAPANYANPGLKNLNKPILTRNIDLKDVEYLENLGYSGLKNSAIGEGTERAIFRPNILKSAVGNVGFFDMKNPNIYKSIISGLGLGALGAGAATQQKKQGGIIKDNDGYWNPDNWGKTVEIQGNTMATHGYGDIPLYVIPDKGDPRIVEANTGTHKFPGATKFTEIPMAQKGKKLPYVVEYTDPRTHEPMEQRFLTAQEADPFFQSVQSGSGTRGYYQNKEYGGPLVEYYKGKMTGPNMFKEGGPVSLNGIIKQNRENREAIRPAVSLGLPKPYTQNRLRINPYLFVEKPESNVNIIGAGFQGEYDINNRFGLTGGANIANVNIPIAGVNEFTKPNFNIGMRYRFEDGGTQYIVKPGDTLSKISRSIGIPVNQIASFNKITNPNLIRVNQTLSIPSNKSFIPEQSYQNWEDIKRRQDALNALQDNADFSGDEQRINQYYTNRPNDSYIVIDKKKARMNVYKGNQLVKSYEVGTGVNPGDAQTVTKIINGKTDWNAGNKSTGAGVYTISNIDPKSHEYYNMPAFNLKNDRGIEVATTIHGTPILRRGRFDNNNLEDNRMSNGCINGKCYDLEDLYGKVEVGSNVYILPEDKGNSIQIVDGKPVLKVSSKNKNKYNQYIDQTGQTRTGQGINQSVNTLQYKPIRGILDRKAFENDIFQAFDFNDKDEYKNNTLPYLTALAHNKKKIMEATHIPSDVYNEIAKMAFGIYGAESNFGDENNFINNAAKTLLKIKPITSTIESISNLKPLIITDDKIGGPDISFKGRLPGGLNADKSVGFTQLRWAQLNNDEKAALKQLGITSNKDLLDPQKSAIAATTVLAIRYNQQLTDEQKKDIWKYLPTKWNSRSGYADRVRNNSKYVRFIQEDAKPSKKYGGSTYVNEYGYLVDKKAGGGEWHHGYYDEYGGDISVPQLPDLQGPLLQYYYSKGGKR